MPVRHKKYDDPACCPNGGLLIHWMPRGYNKLQFVKAAEAYRRKAFDGTVEIFDDKPTWGPQREGWCLTMAEEEYVNVVACPFCGTSLNEETLSVRMGETWSQAHERHRKRSGKSVSVEFLDTYMVKHGRTDCFAGLAQARKVQVKKGERYEGVEVQPSRMVLIAGSAVRSPSPQFSDILLSPGDMSQPRYIEVPNDIFRTEYE